MGWIVLTVILGIVFWCGIGWWVVTRPRKAEQAPAVEGAVDTRMYREEESSSVHWWGLGAAACAAVLWVIASGALMFHTVGQREVGIVYNFSNVITGKKDAGVVTTMPWEHLKKENIGILHDEWQFGADNAAVSVDQQKITSVISVNYQIDPEKVVDLYGRVGPSWKSIIIDARVPQVFKETTATFTTPQLTQEREKLRVKTKERLTAELAPYDIKVIDVFIRNIGFSDSYTESIERKQKQVQDALTAQAKVAQFEAEARQKVAQAEGTAKANIALAKGEATANRLRQKSLTKLLIQQQAIEKLNPDVQVIVCPPQSVCIPNSGIVPNPSTP